MKRIAMGAAAAAGGLLLFGGTAAPALAQSSTTTTVSIIDATQGPCTGGNATWTVHPRITIQNGTPSTVTVKDDFYTGQYNAQSSGEHDESSAQTRRASSSDESGSGGSSQTTSNTSIVDDGGLAGASIASHASKTFTPTVQITIPCNTNAATLFVNYHLVNSEATNSGGAPFITNATGVPTGAVGAVGLAAIVGVGLFTRRKKAVPASEPDLVA